MDRETVMVVIGWGFAAFLWTGVVWYWLLIVREIIKWVKRFLEKGEW